MRGKKKGFGILDILIIISIIALGILLFVPQQIQQKKDKELAICVLNQKELARAEDLYIRRNKKYTNKLKNLLPYIALADSATLAKKYEETFETSVQDSILGLIDSTKLDSTKFRCPTTGKYYIIETSNSGDEFIIRCHLKEHGKTTSKD